ncbi:hypothetical protein WG66_001532 [Moniliophthora roreri]|uniref:Uncharacterized protein n=1 Tax=Moniliophthora roreri TaxID=221103 RepID=A0A0W0G712_MONRR|nr:hypothetical protein WG66_001532 [Moniliophthora roreri]
MELVRNRLKHGTNRYWADIDQTLQDFVYNTSNGHIGAIISLLSMANTARRTVPANERAEVVLYDHFFSYFHSERMFLEGIKYSGGAFPRGLPSNKELSSLSAAEIELFHEVIACECDGTSVRITSDNDSREEATIQLKNKGWLYACETPDYTDDLVLKPASPIHLS